MTDEIYDDVRLERRCKEYFGVPLEVAEVVVRGLPVGVASQATVFKAKNGHVFVCIVAQSGQLLGDVQKIIQRMQCEAEEFLPPHGDGDYFRRIAEAKFKVMFPGKRVTSDEDLRFYRGLAAYNPALVRLARVKGEIRGFEPSSRQWRKAKEYSYSRIRPD